MKLLTLFLLLATTTFAQQKAWREILAQRLAYFGDGNWIVVAESAFPVHAEPGVEMILSDDSQLNTVRHLLESLAKDGHLRPLVYADAELKHVPEQDAPGIEAFRQLLTGLLEKLLPQQPVAEAPHISMMQRLDQAAKSLNVLIIKTNGTLPYTSVYIELKPGYWQDDAERRLRQSFQ